MMDHFSKFDLHSLIAGFVGALIALGFLPRLTVRQAATVLVSGMAVAVYLVPLAIHMMGLPLDSPLARAISFLAGLLGMRVVVVVTRWGDGVENPRDFLDPLRPSFRGRHDREDH